MERNEEEDVGLVVVFPGYGSIGSAPISSIPSPPFFLNLLSCFFLSKIGLRYSSAFASLMAELPKNRASVLTLKQSSDRISLFK